MSRRRLFVLASALAVAACKRGDTEPFGVGRPAREDEIRRLDDDVSPDGTGLPPAHGTVAEGSAVYASRCASCHGATGREGPYDVLVGGGRPEGYRIGYRPAGVDPPTIGNFWPHATTLYDYIHRTMPWEKPGSLTPGETYAVVAWLLHQNGIVDSNATLDERSLPRVHMPALERYRMVLK